MTNIFKKSVLATVLAATALAGSAPAMADGYYGGYHRGGGGAGTAVAAGIFGLAIGAIIGSSVHHGRDDDGGYAEGGYYPQPYARQGWVWHDNYYWDRDGNRYGRDGRFYGGEPRGYDRRGYDERDYRGSGDDGEYYTEQRSYEVHRGW